MTPRLVFWTAFGAVAAWNHWGVSSYVARTPSSLGPETLASLAAVLARTAVAAAFLLMARAAGEAALRRFRFAFADATEAFVFEAALGLGLVSYLLFLLGLLGLWTPPVFLALFVAGLYPAWKARPRLRVPRFDDRLTALLAVPLAAAALKAALASNAPVADWDSLAGHLAFPRLYAEAGRFVPLTSLLHGMDAMAGSLFLVPAMSAGQEALAPLSMTLFQGLMALAAWSAGRRLAGPKAALAAAGLFLVSPAVADASGSCGSDFVVGLWAMLSFWAAIKDAGPAGAKTRWLVLSGAFAGLASVTKVSGLLYAAALSVVVVLDAARRGDRRGPLLWLGAAAAFSAPWLLRAAWHTGNPLWPYFPSLFGGDERALFIGERMRRSVVAGPAEAFGGSWPALLPLAALAAASWRGLRADLFARRLGLYGAVFAVSWTLVQPNWRYAIPLLPWLYVLAARLCDAPWKAAVLAAGFVPLAAFGANNEAFAVLALRPSSGDSPREAYLARRVDAWPGIDRANKTLPPEAKVLLYREVRGYHLERPYLVGDPQNEVRVPYERLDSPDALHRHLLSLGLTHVLVNARRQPFADLPDFRRADALMGRTLRERAVLKDEVGGVLLYELKRF